MARSSLFLEEYRSSCAKFTDATSVFHTASSYTLVGGLLSRQPYRYVVDRGVKGIWPNLWTLLIGSSGSSRKSTVIGMMEAVLKLVDPDLRGPDDMSPEGLLAVLRLKEAQATDPNSLLVFSEFINLLLQFRRQYSQVLRPMLLKMYDVDVIQRSLKKDTFVIQNARCSFIGGIPAAMLAQYGSPEDWAGGFFNRILFVSGKKEREQVDSPKARPQEVLFENLAGKLLLGLEAWKAVAEAHEYLKVDLSPKALEVSREVAKVHRPDEPYLDDMLARAHVHFLKIAAIEQFDEDPEAVVIGEAAAERALKFIFHWAAGLPEIVSTCSTSSRQDWEGDKLPKKVLRYLDQTGGHATLQELLRNCALSSFDMAKAIQSLEASGQIVKREEGRHILLPFATDAWDSEHQVEVPEEHESTAAVETPEELSEFSAVRHVDTSDSSTRSKRRKAKK